MRIQPNLHFWDGRNTAVPCCVQSAHILDVVDPQAFEEPSEPEAPITLHVVRAEVLRQGDLRHIAAQLLADVLAAWGPPQRLASTAGEMMSCRLSQLPRFDGAPHMFPEA